MSETVILTKTLGDGSPCRIVIQPDGETGWRLRVERAGELFGVTKARPALIPKESRPRKGVSHALHIAEKKANIGLTKQEAEGIDNAIGYFVAQQRKAADAKRKRELEELSARLRAVSPHAETWTIQDPHGTPGVGSVQRVDGTIVVGLKAWSRYYGLDGRSFGAADDSGRVYFAEVRVATPEEAAPVLKREASAARRRQLRDRIKSEIVGAAGNPKSADKPDEGDVPDLSPLPEIKLDEMTRLRVDQEGRVVWVLHFNGLDGDNWSYNNFAGYIALRLPLTPERDALLKEWTAVKNDA